MTENEKITINGKEVTLYREVETNLYRFSKDAVDMLLEALEEREQYRAIGTVDEFKALKDKSEPKKPIYKFEYENGTQFYDCPECKRYVTHSGVQSKEKYCSNCGIKLDWSE